MCTVLFYCPGSGFIDPPVPLIFSLDKRLCQHSMESFTTHILSLSFSLSSYTCSPQTQLSSSGKKEVNSSDNVEQLFISCLRTAFVLVCLLAEGNSEQLLVGHFIEPRQGSVGISSVSHSHKFLSFSLSSLPYFAQSGHKTSHVFPQITTNWQVSKACKLKMKCHYLLRRAVSVSQSKADFHETTQKPTRMES